MALYFHYDLDQVQYCFSQHSALEIDHYGRYSKDTCNDDFCDLYANVTSCKYAHPDGEVCGAEIGRQNKGIIRINWRDYIGHFVPVESHYDSPTLALHLYNDSIGQWERMDHVVDLEDNSAIDTSRGRSLATRMFSNRPGIDDSTLTLLPPLGENEVPQFHLSDYQKEALEKNRREWFSLTGKMPYGMSAGWEVYDPVGQMKKDDEERRRRYEQTM